MRGYDYVDEDLDEYEEDGDEYEEVEEQEVEEDPVRKREISEYLVLRQKLKEKARKKLEKEIALSRKSSLETNKTLPLRNFGSFFGPSEPVIADRVIQESKSLLETRNLAPQAHASQNNRKKSVMPEADRPKNVRGGNHLLNPIKSKVQTLKDTRDYSFLLDDDAEGQRKEKDPVRQSNLDSRSNRAPANGRATLVHLDGQTLYRHGEKRRSPGNNHTPGLNRHSVQKLISGGKIASSTPYSNKDLHHKKVLEPRKQISNSGGSGPCRPVMSKYKPSKDKTCITTRGAPSVEKRAPVATEKKSAASMAKASLVPSLDRKVSIGGVKHIAPSGQRPHSVKTEAMGARHKLEQRGESQGQAKLRILPPKSLSSSKSQMVNLTKHPSRTNLSQDCHKKKPVPSRWLSDDRDDDDSKAINMIRKMFGYNPSKYVDDDDNTSDMEADFNTILREEKKSARIAREEDEREARLIEEEERRERMRREAKRRKLSQR